VERAVPAGDRARHPGRQTAVAGVVEGERAASLRERLGTHRARRQLARVDRGDLALARANHHEATAADAARVGLRDPEYRSGGHGRVDGVAAAPQRVDGRLGPAQVDAGGRAPAPGRRRLLGFRLRERDLGIEEDDGHERGDEQSEQHHAFGIPGPGR
jgi:hypothetical protein